MLKEIRDRLKFLVDVGLDYLTLSRASGTLSGGESQRIRLASQIGSGLTGVLYVLDEPSIGLHQRDNARLLVTLRRLRDLGNTVIVVEHDEDAIRSADYVLDMGPGAGIHGGKIVAQGTPDAIMASKDSLTGKYLTGAMGIPVPERRPRGRRSIKVLNARGHNLKNITAEIPLGLFTCVTGVSGGGKSTLLVDTLYAAVARKLNNASLAPAPHDRIEGLEHIDKIIDIDQSPIGRTPRSNPATYTGAFTPIREWFAGLPEAKARGYEPGRFSFNVKGGRCEACEGDGVIKIEMHFLPDVYVTCDVCKGKRYNRETLDVTFKNKSIADVLDMTVDEAQEFFKAVPRIRNVLETLQRVGLGYIHVGQQATTLVRRRGAAHQARQGAVEALDRPHALHSRRAHHRIAFPRRGEAARRAAPAGRGRQHHGGDRAQSRSDQDRRLDHRPRPRRRRRRRRDRRGRHAGGRGEGGAELYGAVFEAGAGAAGARAEEGDSGGGVARSQILARKLGTMPRGADPGKHRKDRTMKRNVLAGLIATLGLLGATTFALSLSTVAAAEAYEYPAGGTRTTKSIPEPADAALRDRERQALIAFYKALGGPDWNQRDFWASGRPVGAWHGVETDADGRVVALMIYDNNVTGKLPPALCELQRLHTLHLSFNKVAGALPDELGDCRALKNLWLKGNRLTGRLPNSVAVLPELEYLDVHANDLSGSLPTNWDTPKLKIFRAEDNRITGSLPGQLLRQPRLEQIFLHNNELTGPIPTSLGANLGSLLLANNKLSGPIPAELGRLKKLTDLRLNRNQLSGPIPANLADAASLQVLRLDHNRLNGPIPRGLAKRLMLFDASDNPDVQAVR